LRVEVFVPDSQRVAPLLDLDPDLAQFLAGERAEEAHRQLLVRVRRLPPGAWNTARLTVADPGHLGLLVLDGVLSREVLATDVISTELIGAGELLRPWQIAPDPRLLRVSVRWNVLADARVAVLDRRLAAQLGRYPEIMSLLIERMTARTQRLAVSQAIAQLNRVDRRLLMLFWHLAERWGRMTPDGVAIPLTLSHRMLSHLVGARRPTVSTALGDLAKEQQVVRQPDGSWLLTGEPIGEPIEHNTRLVPPRRRMLVSVPAPPAVARDESHERPAARERVSRDELMATLQRVREDCERTRLDLQVRYSAATEICREIAERRAQRAARGAA
jgi:CRP/FNR family transcriptional regulator, cyclic AMP receptor protein